MKRTLTLLLLLAAAGGCRSIDPLPGPSVSYATDVLGYYEYVEKTDTRCTIVCSEARLLKTPEWKTNESNPPLSPREALRIARLRLPDFVTSPKEWRLLAVELSQEYCSKRWYYKANFVKHIIASFPPQFGVYILMDGTVVEPEPYKK